MFDELAPLPSWDSAATLATFQEPELTYRGRVLQKSADDLRRYRELIDWSRPDLVIETGTRDGGSALWFQRQGLEVISIDPAPRWGGWEATPKPQPGLAWIQGSSISDWVVAEVHKLIGGKRVMVSLDADHHSLHVQAEIATYASLVSPGCFLVVEDACFDMWDGDDARRGGRSIPEFGGPLDAIRKMDPRRIGFERATDIEEMSPVSHSPVGWWVREETT